MTENIYVRIDTPEEMMDFAMWYAEEQKLNLDSFGYPVSDGADDEVYCVDSIGRLSEPSNSLPAIFSIRENLQDNLIWSISHMPIAKAKEKHSGCYDSWKNEAIPLEAWFRRLK